jgi:Flp pilus assembly protein TadG
MMQVRQKTNPNPIRCGAALVEFAVVLPIILLIFAAMIEISRVLLLQHSADTAAYEGARNAMVPGATSDEATQAAQALLTAAGLKSSKITVTPTEITEATPLITVQVEIPIAPNAWISPTWFGQSSVTSETTLFCERPPMVQLTGIPQMQKKSTNIKKLKGKATGTASGATAALGI